VAGIHLAGVHGEPCGAVRWMHFAFILVSFLSAIAFFDHINLVYGTISEFCTMSGCPDMTGPGLR